MSKILPRFPQWISPRISLPVANLGEIPSKIVLRFLPPWICSLARILGRFAVAFWRDFGHWDSCFSARILARFTAGSRRDFDHWDFSSLGESRWDPGKILTRKRNSWRPKSHRDPAVQKIPAAQISLGSCRESYQDSRQEAIIPAAKISPECYHESHQDSRRGANSRWQKPRRDLAGNHAKIGDGKWNSWWDSLRESWQNFRHAATNFFWIEPNVYVLKNTNKSKLHLRSFHWNRTYTEIFVKLCLLIVYIIGT